jgi:group II intron reverse transcriptase/maturase
MDVDKMQKKLAVWADRNPDHRFFDIYHLLYDENWLDRAYRSVKSNAGSRTAGVDGLNMSDFEEELERNLRGLRQSLKDETFDPKPVRRIHIPKGDGRERPLGIPTIKDRIVQEALRMVLEPIYETDFSQYSYGFRPNRSTMDALNVVKMATRENMKYFWVIDADIKGFFDNVDHQTLEQIIQDRIKDQQIRDLIWEFLKAGIMEEGEYRNSVTGTPQGGIVSPLLANVYLNELDQWVKRWTDLPQDEKRKRRRNDKGNWMYVRYADDFLLLSNGRKPEMEEMEDRLREYLGNDLDLTLSKKKTEIVHVNDGFDFLGFHVERRENRKGEKQTQITIPKEAVEDFRETIHVATNGDHNSSERSKIMALNPVIRGWGNYYRYCWSSASTFHDLDNFIWRQVMHWMARKHKTSVRKAVKRLEGEGTRIEIAGATLKRMADLDGSATYTRKILKDHPYLEQESINREELPEEQQWLGSEGDRAGFEDQRHRALERDDWTCQKCGGDLMKSQAQVHHIKPVRKYSNPEEANRLDNLKSLCPECHEEITYSR